MIKFWNINYHYHFSSDDFLNSFALLMPTCTLPGFHFFIASENSPIVAQSLPFYLCMCVALL